jgi:hypothetical protein
MYVFPNVEKEWILASVFTHYLGKKRGVRSTRTTNEVLFLFIKGDSRERGGSSDYVST